MPLIASRVMFGGVVSSPPPPLLLPKRMKRLTGEPMFQLEARYSPASGDESK